MRVQSQEIAWIVSQDRSLNKCNTIDAILRKDVHKNLKAIVVGVGRVSVLDLDGCSCCDNFDHESHLKSFLVRRAIDVYLN